MKQLQREHYILLGLCGFLLAVAVTTDYHRVVNYLYSDEAVYYMMAQSLAFDRDMEYTPQDLQRVYADGWYAGPQGVYLTKAANGKIYYGKYLAYAFFLAPFIAIFGFKGFLILNVLLLGGMLWMGWAYLRQFNPPSIALLIALTFFLLSASFIYTFWLAPETFNMFCITGGLFLWLYRREELGRTNLHFSASPLFKGIQWLWQTPAGRMYLAPIPIAVACASKITNLLFLAPILADVVFEYKNRPKPADLKKSFGRRFLPYAAKILLLGVIFGITAGIFFGLQYQLTGNFNQYAGDRKMFIGNFPFNTPNEVWNQGIRHSNEDYREQSFFLTPKTFLYNSYYYIFGRFTGMLPYFGCSLLALFYFGRSVFARRTSSFRQPELWRRLMLLGAISASIAGYIIGAPINYHGGSGAFGNRFFLNMYPAFLFLITAVGPRSHERRVPVPLVLAWLGGSLFLAQAVLNPFQTSYYPAGPAFKFPYRFLPVELTLINALPTHVNPHLTIGRDDQNPPYRIYLMDENMANLTKPDEFWVMGERTAELVLLTYTPQDHLAITVTNGPLANQVDVSVAGVTQTVQFNTPGERRRLIFPLNWSMPYFKASLYPVKIRSHTGFVPKFTPDTELKDSRYLGCGVNLALSPIEAGRTYLETAQLPDALATLKLAVQQQPNDIQARYYLGLAYQQMGKMEAAIREFERCKTLLPDFQKTWLARNPPLSKDAMFNAPIADNGQNASDLAHLLQPLTRVYEAEDLHHKVGQIVAQPDASNGKAVVFQPAQDSAGFLVYGPYLELPPGQYQAKYRIKVGRRPEQPVVQNAAALFFDVYNPKQASNLAADSILVEDAAADNSAQYADYTLNFEIISPTPVEFRVYPTGAATVAVDRIAVYPRLPLQIYHALGRVKSDYGAEAEAYQELRQAAAIDPWTPDLQIDCLHVLLKLAQWDAAVQFTKQGRRFSSVHTGLATYFNLHPADLASKLPDRAPAMLTQFYNDLQAHFTPPIPMVRNFEDQLAFMGYAVSAQKIAPGGKFGIHYYWKALKNLDADYAMFVHFTKKGKFLDPEMTSRIKRKLHLRSTDLFQQDHQPLQGAYPTRQWMPHELIGEQYEVAVPSDLEPGTYEIWLGVWNPFTRTRLESEGQTKVKIGEIQIN